MEAIPWRCFACSEGNHLHCDFIEDNVGSVDADDFIGPFCPCYLAEPSIHHEPILAPDEAFLMPEWLPEALFCEACGGYVALVDWSRGDEVVHEECLI